MLNNTYHTTTCVSYNDMYYTQHIMWYDMIFLHDISVQTTELIQINELQKYIFSVIVFNI